MTLPIEKEKSTHAEGDSPENDTLALPGLQTDHKPAGNANHADQNSGADTMGNGLGAEALHGGRTTQVQPGAVSIEGPLFNDTQNHAHAHGQDDVGLPLALPVGELVVIEGSIIMPTKSRRKMKLAFFVTTFIFVMTVMNLIVLPLFPSISAKTKNILSSVSDTNQLEDQLSVQHFSWMTTNDLLKESKNFGELLQNPGNIIQLYLSILIPMSTSSKYSLPTNKVILDYCALRTCNDHGQVSTMVKGGRENSSMGGGIIATEIGHMRGLTDLVFQNNSIVGTIPTEIGTLENLRTLDLSNNMLSGTIPTEIGNLENLEWVFFGNNLLEGTIPTELGNLKRLKYLDISSNSLQGSIPLQISKTKSLVGLSIRENNFSDISMHSFCLQTFRNGTLQHIVEYTGLVQQATFNYILDLGITTDCIDGSPTFDCDCCACA